MNSKNVNVLQELNRLIESKDNEIFELKKQYASLREDFQFNLALIDQRDKDLEDCDTMIEFLKKNSLEKESEALQLRSLLEEREQKLQHLSDDFSSSQKASKEQISHLKDELYASNEYRESSLRIAQENFDSERKSLSRQVSQLEQQLEDMRSQYITGTEESMRQLRSEYEGKIVMLEDDLKKSKSQIRTFEQKLTLAAQENEKLLSEVMRLKEASTNMERDFRRVKWESEDSTSVLAGKLNDFEKEINELQASLEQANKDKLMWEERHRDLSSKELPELEARIHEEEKKREVAEREARQMESEKAALLKQIEEKTREIERKGEKHYHAQIALDQEGKALAELKAHLLEMDAECKVRDDLINQMRAELELAAKRVEKEKERYANMKEKVKVMKDVPRAVQILVDEHQFATREMLRELRQIRVENVTTIQEEAVRQKEVEVHLSQLREENQMLQSQIEENEAKFNEEVMKMTEKVMDAADKLEAIRNERDEALKELRRRDGIEAERRKRRKYRYEQEDSDADDDDDEEADDTKNDFRAAERRLPAKKSTEKDAKDGDAENTLSITWGEGTGLSELESLIEKGKKDEERERMAEKKRKENRKKEAEIRSLNEEIASLKKKNEELQKEIQSLKESADATKKDFQKVKAYAKEKRDEAKREKEEKERAVMERQSREQEIERKSKQELKQVLSSLQQQQQEVAHLQHERDTLISINSTLRAVLAKAPGDIQSVAMKLIKNAEESRSLSMTSSISDNLEHSNKNQRAQSNDDNIDDEEPELDSNFGEDPSDSPVDLFPEEIKTKQFGQQNSLLSPRFENSFPLSHTAPSKAFEVSHDSSSLNDLISTFPSTPSRLPPLSFSLSPQTNTHSIPDVIHTPIQSLSNSGSSFLRFYPVNQTLHVPLILPSTQELPSSMPSNISKDQKSNENEWKTKTHKNFNEDELASIEKLLDESSSTTSSDADVSSLLDSTSSSSSSSSSLSISSLSSTSSSTSPSSSSSDAFDNSESGSSDALTPRSPREDDDILQTEKEKTSSLKHNAKHGYHNNSKSPKSDHHRSKSKERKSYNDTQSSRPSNEIEYRHVRKNMKCAHRSLSNSSRNSHRSHSRDGNLRRSESPFYDDDKQNELPDLRQFTPRLQSHSPHEIPTPLPSTTPATVHSLHSSRDLANKTADVFSPQRRHVSPPSVPSILKHVDEKGLPSVPEIVGMKIEMKPRERKSSIIPKNKAENKKGKKKKSNKATVIQQQSPKQEVQERISFLETRLNEIMSQKEHG
ncbi:uncharacterized protein MONOS_9540 [Monocercomonoides exilis]|uniref:uncharacterized protein n=1 Tax=Monocercomonoides exilis TaxID=2049356 RepID=UPI003559D188|nr:hypothetical protein MONOS_9540 [Monocercomonoides exilis]|eukprot:MONOS_9540.1-p1 / transcript=MONOS_9540.1 / gene=MONOS_9540 / organism=Monocercomonoides_exilis_PA203 / gene_product=unspecified product / transcript_product=unspecified product / location=Mono_scaffold00398:8604-12987(+) / protein_length=1265 / sequence_SO=supercontig / SO=protein_coding / is_pseudo=false